LINKVRGFLILREFSCWDCIDGIKKKLGLLVLAVDDFSIFYNLPCNSASLVQLTRDYFHPLLFCTLHRLLIFICKIHFSTATVLLWVKGTIAASMDNPLWWQRFSWVKLLLLFALLAILLFVSRSKWHWWECDGPSAPTRRFFLISSITNGDTNKRFDTFSCGRTWFFMILNERKASVSLANCKTHAFERFCSCSFW